MHKNPQGATKSTSVTTAPAVTLPQQTVWLLLLQSQAQEPECFPEQSIYTFSALGRLLGRAEGHKIRRTVFA